MSLGSSPFQERKVVVLGAGIIGCTTARTLLQQGFQVTIVAKHLPGDEDIWYASNWAGALWHGARYLSNDLHRYLEAVSYRRFKSDNINNPECGVCVIQLDEYFEKKPKDPLELWFKGVNPKFRDMEKSKYEGTEFEYGCEYETLAIEPHRYLVFIKQEIEKLGGQFIRKSIESMDELYQDYEDSVVFVNASGVGPMTIKGLEDDKCYPNRGQNVLVRTKTDKAFSRSGEEYTYVIPRPLSGVVVCGGLNEPNKTHADIDMEIAQDEIRRAHKLAPEVVSEAPDIAGYVVGIRPARKGGFRLEKEQVAKNKYIIHAYGFNGGGYAFSYGAAYMVGTLVEEIEKEYTSNTRKRSFFSW
jgi:D-amino-acid oxidase